MNILRVISSVNPKNGGPTNGMINSSNGLVALGHHVQVASLDDPAADYAKNFAFPLVAFKGKFGTFGYSSELSQWLMNHVNDYDVVVIHGLWQWHAYAAAKACVQNNVPFVVFTHGMLDPWFNEGHLLKTCKKRIYWQLFEKLTLNKANAVLFTSEEERDLARLSFSPYQPVEKVVAYGSPLPTTEKNEAQKTFLNNFPELQNKQFFLFLSRIHPKKGIDLLIEALNQYNALPDDFCLAIAGPDDVGLKAKLEKQIEANGLTSKVIWLGMLEGVNKWGAFHAASAFILPSHQENFGIVVAEALSTSTPVLITNKVNIWREIEAANAGCISADTEKGIYQLIAQWFNLSQAQKQSMSANALACYQQNFSIESAIADLNQTLAQVVKEHE